MAKKNSPTSDEWRGLYEAAVAFRDLAPWQWLEEDQLFGVENPEDGSMGYCCVMGAAGEHFALAVYRGAGGLEGFWELRERVFELADPGDLLDLQNCVMASFEDREALETPDREVIRSLGLKFRGRAQWPLFRSYRPGYWPWVVEGPEARFLTTALRQAMEVTSRARTEPNLLPHALPGTPLLVRVPSGPPDQLVWQDAHRVPEPAPRERPAIPQPDAGSLRRVASLPPTDGVLEVGWMRMPEPVQDGRDSRPFFMWSILVVEPSSGLVVGMDVARPEERDAKLQQAVLGTLEKVEMLPAEVRVEDEQVADVVAPLTEPLGIRLSQKKRLRALDGVQRELAAFAGGMPAW